MYLIRAKALLNIIYQQEEVVKQLIYISEDIQTVGNTTLTVYIQTKLCAEGKPGVRLKIFNFKADIAVLDISTLAKQV